LQGVPTVMGSGQAFDFARCRNDIEQGGGVESAGGADAAFEQVANRHDAKIRAELLRQVCAFVTQNLNQSLSDVAETDDCEFVLHEFSVGTLNVQRY